MADPLTNMAVLASRLESTADVVDSGGEIRWVRGLRGLAQRGRTAQDAEAARCVVSDVLRLFGGVGSLNDLVLQSPVGVLPAQKDLERCRGQLFEAARDAIGEN